MSDHSKPLRAQGLPRRAVLAAIAVLPVVSVARLGEPAPVPATVAVRAPVFSF